MSMGALPSAAALLPGPGCQGGEPPQSAADTVTHELMGAWLAGLDSAPPRELSAAPSGAAGGSTAGSAAAAPVPEFDAAGARAPAPPGCELAAGGFGSGGTSTAALRSGRAGAAALRPTAALRSEPPGRAEGAAAAAGPVVIIGATAAAALACAGGSLQGAASPAPATRTGMRRQVESGGTPSAASASAMHASRSAASTLLVGSSLR